MTFYYIGEKRVTKDKLSKNEIHDEDVKRIFAEHLRRKKKINNECGENCLNM